MGDLACGLVSWVRPAMGEHLWKMLIWTFVPDSVLCRGTA
jgi:hypothetical protein